MPVEATLEVLKSCLLVLTALFPIVNPLGNNPIYLSLTPGYSSEARSMLARRVALNSFWLLTGSMLIGSHILNFFGISIPVVQIGGGLVVMSTGWALLKSGGEPAPAENMGRSLTCEDIANRAFYPLTLPLTVGPGSISVALTLGANTTYRSTIVRLIASTVGPALVAATVYLSYRSAERLAKFLGRTAMNVFIRLTSFILLCIGVQIFWNGISALGTSFFNRR